MKTVKSFLAILGCLSILSSCTDSGLTIDSARQKATVDSLVSVRSEVLKDSINRVCQDRLQNEVAAKVDSSMTALKEQAAAENESN